MQTDGAVWYVNHAHTAGYGVKSDGDLIAVWSTVKGQGKQIVESAVINGAVKLDCFDGFLVDFYSDNGFSVVNRVSNWDGAGFPDVVYMQR